MLFPLQQLRVSRSTMTPFVCLAGLLLAGCGSGGEASSTGQVSGRITSQGQPITAGTVYLSAKGTGAGGSATLDQNGNFVIEEAVPVGDYAVAVTPPEPVPGAAAPGADANAAKIPQKYRSDQTTDLTATIQPGDNTLEFDLKP